MGEMRILVLGTSGSGKTTVARRVAARLGIPHIELDAIRHLENWTELPDEEFRRAVARIAATDAWVIDGNYGVVRDITLARATHVVWLDMPKWLVMAQVVWRSLSRAAFRQELWNGNRESFRAWLHPGHPIWWAWQSHGRRRANYARQMASHWVRLRSRRDVDRWLRGLDPLAPEAAAIP